MAKARVINSRGGQIILLPKEIRIRAKEVEIFREGDEIILREIMPDMHKAFHLIAGLDFAERLKNRHKDAPQKSKRL